MPYPSEHAARMKDPKQFTSFSRKVLGAGVTAIIGWKDSKSTIQAYRFDKTKFSPAEAKKWLKDHKEHYILFEAAKTEDALPATLERPVNTFDMAMTIDVPTKREYTKEGYLIVPARLAQPGLFEYYGYELPGVPDLDKLTLYKVWSPAATLFDPETMKSFENKPFVDDHKMVDATDWRGKTVGFVRDIYKEMVDDKEYLMGTIVVTDSETISEIEGGKKEISLGYDGEYFFAKDMPEDSGIPKDADLVRTRMIGNHVALVKEGRAGHDCKIMDAKGAEMDKVLELLNELKTMLAQLLELEKKEQEGKDKLPPAPPAPDKEKEEMGKKLAEMDAQIKTLCDAKAALEKTNAPEAVEAAAEDRAAVMLDAKRLLPTIDCRGKSIKKIMIEVLQAKHQDAAKEIDAILKGTVLTNDAIDESAVRSAFSFVSSTADEHGVIGHQPPKPEDGKTEDYGDKLMKANNVHAKK